MITKCPKCETIFNVRKDQLAAAKGLVRCGSCMSVFNAVKEASESLDKPQPNLQKSAYTRPTDISHKPMHAAQQQRPTMAAPHAQKAPLPANANQYPTTAQNTTNNSVKPPPAKIPKTPNESGWSQTMQANLKSIDDDIDKLEQSASPFDNQQSIAEQNTARQLDPAPMSTKPDNESDEISDEFMSLSGTKEHQDAFSLETHSDANQSSASLQDENESWVENLLDELDHDKSASSKFDQPSSEEVKINKVGQNEDKKPKPTHDFSFDTSRLDQDIADFFVSSDEIQYSTKEKESLETNHPDESKAKALNHLNDEPLESTRSNESKKGKWLQILLSLIIAVLFAGQYLYYNFDKLANDKFWRPKLAFLCQHAPCTIKPLRDPKQIKTVSVSMREHPTKENTLFVDAIIFSLAEVPIPFPNLVLNFTDLNGASEKKLTIQPKDYRNGDLLQYDMLPPEKTIQISFEIEDSGFTNYSLNFEYPSAP